MSDSIARSALDGLSVFPRRGVSLRRRLWTVLALSLFMSAGIAQQAVSLPHSPSPRLFLVTDLGQDDVELTEVQVAEDGLIMSTIYRPLLQDIGIYDARGNELDAEGFLMRIGVGSVVLVAADENPIDAIYLDVLKDDTVVLLGVVVRVEVE